MLGFIRWVVNVLILWALLLTTVFSLFTAFISCIAFGLQDTFRATLYPAEYFEIPAGPIVALGLCIAALAFMATIRQWERPLWRKRK